MFHVQEFRREVSVSSAEKSNVMSLMRQMPLWGRSRYSSPVPTAKIRYRLTPPIHLLASAMWRPRCRFQDSRSPPWWKIYGYLCPDNARCFFVYEVDQGIRMTSSAFLVGQEYLLPIFAPRLYSTQASVIYILRYFLFLLQPSPWFNFRPWLAFWLRPLWLLVRLLLRQSLLLLLILLKGWFPTPLILLKYPQPRATKKWALLKYSNPAWKELDSDTLIF